MSQNVNVNLTPGGYPKEFHVSQYDVGRQLVAKVVDSTGDYSIPSGATVVLVGTKPSGFGFTLNGTVSGSTVTFSTTATVTAEYGRIPCELRITSGSTILGTANCMLIVEESPHPEGTTDGDGEQIISEITLLLQRITEQADRADQAVTDATAQANRATAQATAAAGSASAAASSETNAAASEATAVGAKNDAVAAKTAAQASEQAAAESAAEAEATLGSYAKVGGEYDGMTVGTAKQLLSDSTTTDTEPYIYRQTAGDGDREEVEVVGGTVAWNQLGRKSTQTKTDAGIAWTQAETEIIANGTAESGAFITAFDQNITVINGHKYLFYGVPSGGGLTSYSAIASNYSITRNPRDIGNGVMFQAYGTDSTNLSLVIAEGVTVSNLKFKMQFFDLTAMFGPTVADAVYAMEQASAGAGVAWFKKLFPKAYYPYNAGELMSVKTSAHVTTGFNQWDGTSNIGYYWSDSGVLTPFGSNSCTGKIPVIPSRDYYFINKVANATVKFYDDSMTLLEKTGISSSMIVESPSESAYLCVNYNSTTGVPPSTCINLSSSKNGTYEPYDGHTYPLSPIDLRGIPKWVDGKLKFDGDVYEADGTVTRNTVYRAYQSGDESLANAITDGSHTVVYSANASTETADPYTAIQVCDPNGTEEWTDERTVQIPVGNVTKYHANLKEKLEDLPTIPSAPSANGTYTLKATVSGGTVTYQWVNG